MEDSSKQRLGLQEVVERLQTEYGSFYEADYKAGRKQFVRFLRGDLGLKRKQADELVDILEDNRSLRYVPPVELQEELFRDPRRAAELVTSPSLREVSLLTTSRRSDKAHWLIGE